MPFTLPVVGLDEIPIQPFGVLVAMGIIIGARVAEKSGLKRGVDPAELADFVMHIVLTGILCGYFLNAAFYAPDVFLSVLSNPTLIFKKYLGLSSYGGFIGSILGAFIWKWRRKRPIIKLSDAAVTGFATGWIFGRTGCFIVHDHPGAPSDFFLAVDNYQYATFTEPFVARHDLGLYEVIWAITATAIFYFLQRSKTPRPAGFYAALLPLLYAPVRFFLDYLRAPPSEGGDVRYIGMTPAQYASVALLALGIGLMLWAYRNAQQPPEQAKR